MLITAVSDSIVAAHEVPAYVAMLFTHEQSPAESVKLCTSFWQNPQGLTLD